MFYDPGDEEKDVYVKGFEQCLEKSDHHMKKVFKYIYLISQQFFLFLWGESEQENMQQRLLVDMGFCSTHVSIRGQHNVPRSL